MAGGIAPTSSSLVSGHCGGGFSVAEFFKDSPWLRIPKDRIGEILIEPLYPRGGLLGGASKQDNAPRSKLAALAAARKTKENERLGLVQTTSSVVLLDKLGGKSREQKPVAKINSSISDIAAAEQVGDVQAKKGVARQSTATAILQAEKWSQRSPATQGPPPVPQVIAQAELAPFAAPSVFAQTISGPFEKKRQLAFALPHYNVQSSECHTEYNFAGPSPDDVVTKAQNTKGAGLKPAKQNSKITSDEKSVNGVTQAVGDVSIEDNKVRGKNLDVLAEFENSKPKNAANFVVIGTG